MRAIFLRQQSRPSRVSVLLPPSGGPGNRGAEIVCQRESICQEKPEVADVIGDGRSRQGGDQKAGVQNRRAPYHRQNSAIGGIKAEVTAISRM